MSEVSNMSNIEQISGNIQTEICSAKINVFTSDDNGFQAVKFFFTYHLEQGEQKDTFEQAFLKLEGLKSFCNKFVWGEEYGKSGKTPHIQGAFILKSKMRWSTIENNFF